VPVAVFCVVSIEYLYGLNIKEKKRAKAPEERVAQLLFECNNKNHIECAKDFY